MLCALAAKSTVGYSFPTEMKHPLTGQLWPHIISGKWTADQWPVALGLSPAASSAAFVLAFALGLYLLVRIDRAARSIPLP
jgi:hypothetical protein